MIIRLTIELYRVNYLLLNDIYSIFHASADFRVNPVQCDRVPIGKPDFLQDVYSFNAGAGHAPEPF